MILVVLISLPFHIILVPKTDVIFMRIEQALFPFQMHLDSL